MNPYTVLGVNSSDSEATIRTKYLELVRKYHHDRNPGKANEEKLKQINSAYDLLKNKPKTFNSSSKPKANQKANPRTFTIRMSPRHNMYGFNFTIDGKVERVRSGGLTGDTVRFSNGDVANLILEIPEPFRIIHGHHLVSDIWIKAKENKRHKWLKTPVLNPDGTVRYKSWLIHKPFKDGEYCISGDGLALKNGNWGKTYVCIHIIKTPTLKERFKKLFKWQN